MNKHLFGINDIASLKGINKISFSPDCSKVLCTITEINLINNSEDSFIALIDVETKQKKVITKGSDAQWSPIGNDIAYIGDDEAIWIYNLDRAEKTYLTPIFHSSYFMGHMAEKDFSWSPNGEYIAFLSTVPYLEPDVFNQDIKEIDRLSFKTKGGRGRPYFADNHLTHIWIIPVAGGAPIQLTEGNYNEHSISWTSDSRSIFFVSNRSEDLDNNQYYDLWSVAIKNKEVKRYTNQFGTIHQPRCSPDGNYISFIATTGRITTNDSPAEDTKLYIIPVSVGVPEQLAGTLDRRIENVLWHKDSENIYFTAGNEGKTGIYRVSSKTGVCHVILEGESHISEYALSPNRLDLLYVKSDVCHPSELFLFRQKESENIQLSHINTSVVDHCVFRNVESLWFESFDGIKVQGWIMKPAIYDDAKKYPLIVVIHGGPHNMFGYAFEERMQLLSSKGYGVLYLNPRGSSGYGQAFSNGTLLNWGGGDYKDIMEGLDYAIDNYSWIDKDNLGVTGQSYGGYMTNWIITQTNRFKVAVVDGGISNLISFAGTSLYHSLMESEFNGNVYDNFSLLWHCSPLRNVKNVKTPTLFLHGESDNEVPVSQAEEMFIALKKLGVKTSLIQYLGEGHGWRPDLTPKIKADLYNRMMDWIDQNLSVY